MNWIKTIVFGVICGVSGGVAVFFMTKNNEKVHHNVYVENHQSPSTHQVGYLGDLENVDLVRAAEIAKSSVVFIKSKSTQTSNYSLLDLYFGHGSGGATGSGVIFDAKGYIVTNYHVIDGFDDIEVVHQKRVYPAEVIGYDKSTDLAVLKIDANNLTPFKLGSSSQSKTGEWVLAVGNPLNLNSTVTAGIISAKGRVINIMEGSFPIESFIQTDAAINPGNSGGALVNGRGELIGINTAIVSETGSYSGYGFAVPIDIVRKVVNDLITYGELQKAFIGASIKELTNGSSTASKASLNGVVLYNVDPSGAANTGGLQDEDVILSINGISVNTAGEFNEQISFFRPGDVVKIKYTRNGKVSETNVELLNEDGGTGVIKHETYYSTELGAELEVISTALAKKLNLKGGVKVVRYTSRGLLRRVGVREGTIITQVNGLVIKNIDDLEYILSNIKGRVSIKGTTEGGGQSYYSAYF